MELPNISVCVAREYNMKLASADLLKRTCNDCFSMLVTKLNTLLYASLSNVPFFEKPFVRGPKIIHNYDQ